MANRSARAIEPSDLRRLIDALDLWASYTPIGMRISALVQLAHGSALDLNEALSLKMSSALNEGGYAFPRKILIGGAQAVVPPQCHQPLQRWVLWARDYVARARIKTAPLFFSPLEDGKPLEVFNSRTAQDHFAEAQERAKLAARYRFQDLRHDALNRSGRAVRPPTRRRECVPVLAAADRGDAGRAREARDARQALACTPSRQSVISRRRCGGE